MKSSCLLSTESFIIEMLFVRNTQAKYDICKFETFGREGLCMDDQNDQHQKLSVRLCMFVDPFCLA